MEAKHLKTTLSPLAKYHSKGNIFCVICKANIKSLSIWKVHVNSKLHKCKVEEMKKLNKQTLEKSLQKSQRLKATFQTTLNKNKQIHTLESEGNICLNKDLILKPNSSSYVLQGPTDILPERFFDDHFVDAKIRNAEYRNLHDDEWERFQREIKEESFTSNNLIFGEQTNTALEREITEISEQIHQWSKVINLEQKLHNLKHEKQKNELNETDDDSSNDDLNENLDWRSKKIS